MRAETRNRLWSAMLWTALAAVMVGIVATAGAFDASVLLPVIDTGGTPIPALAWYKLDGDVLDSSGNGRNGTVIDAVVTNGYFGQAYYFNGLNDAINMSIPALDAGTVSAWVRSDFDVTSLRCVVGGTGLSWSLCLSSVNAVRLTAGNFSNVSSANNTTVPLQWSHIAFSADGTNTIVYHNGESVALGTQSGGFTPTRIGRRSNDSTIFQNMVGVIDDVRVYNRVLSPANIQRVMTGQTVEPIEELQ